MIANRLLPALACALLLTWGCNGSSGTTANSSSSETETETETESASGPTTSTVTSPTSSTNSTSAGPSGSDSASEGSTGENTTTSGSTGSSASSSGSSSGSETSETTQGNVECVPKLCDGKQYECGDCLDNDGDGLVDQADPECLSPCDDREDVFTTGIPGDNMDACNQDCFFDGNSGAGDDGCNWNLKCDPENPGGEDCPYDPNFNNCPEMQSEECAMNCPVPAGCDCFGCCTVSVGDESYDIYIGDPDCSLDMIELCQPCSKNDDCDDDCQPEMCELCFGQNPDDLPPECDENECDVDQLPCVVDDMGGDNCPDGYFCFVGCCEIEIG